MRKYLSLLTALLIAPSAYSFTISDGFEPTSKPASFWTGGYDSLLSSAFPMSGTGSLRFKYPGVANGQDGFVEQRFTIPEKSSELYVEYDLYIPSNYYHRTQGGTLGSDNNKSLVQLWSGSYGAVASNVYVGLEHWPTGNGSSTPTIRMGANHVDLGHTPISKMSVGKNIIRVPEDAGKWRHFKVHVKLADAGKANGIVEVWRDSELIIQTTTLNNYSAAGNYFDQGYILGWSNSGYATETTFYVDNFKISSSATTTAVPTANPPSAPALSVTGQ